MSYGPLPFYKPTGQGFVLGEKVAPLWKRLASTAVDYGWIAVALGVKIPAVIVASLVVLNTVIAPVVTAQSLGRYLTKTSIVVQGRKRLVKPGYLHGAIRLLVVIGPLFALWLILLNVEIETEAQAGVVLAIFWGLVFVTAYLIPERDQLTRNPADFVAGTVVVDRVMNLSDFGRKRSGAEIR